MSELDQIFIGLLLVGTFLIFKVVKDGLKHLDTVKLKLEDLRVATVECQAKTAEEQTAVQQAETEVAEQKREVSELDEEAKSLDTTIKSLKSKRDQKSRTRFKIDPGALGGQ